MVDGARDIEPVEPYDGWPTEDERTALAEAGFELSKGFNDYGGGDLILALRKGYELGRQDGQMIWQGES